MAHHARSNAVLHLSRPRLHPLTVAIGLTAGTLLPISSATFAQDTEQLSSITVVGEDLRPTTELSDTYRVESSAQCQRPDADASSNAPVNELSDSPTDG